MRRIHRVLVVSGVLSTFALSALLPAYAGSTGRKNTAIALTAATVYGVVKKKNRVALVAGVGAAQAWKNYEDARKRESRRRSHVRYVSYRHHKEPRGHAYGHYKNNWKHR